jgi:hypothetical protein
MVKRKAKAPEHDWPSIRRWGTLASAGIGIIVFVSYIFPAMRNVANSDPPPFIGKSSFEPVAKTVNDIQTEQRLFIQRLQAFDVSQMQRDCLALADRKEGLELRRQMSGQDRLVRETYNQVLRTIERLQKQIEAAGEVPNC